MKKNTANHQDDLRILAHRHIVEANCMVWCENTYRRAIDVAGGDLITLTMKLGGDPRPTFLRVYLQELCFIPPQNLNH